MEEDIKGWKSFAGDRDLFDDYNRLLRGEEAPPDSAFLVTYSSHSIPL